MTKLIPDSWSLSNRCHISSVATWTASLGPVGLLLSVIPLYSFLLLFLLLLLLLFLLFHLSQFHEAPWSTLQHTYTQTHYIDVSTTRHDSGFEGNAWGGREGGRREGGEAPHASTSCCTFWSPVQGIGIRPLVPLVLDRISLSVCFHLSCVVIN